MKPGDQQLQYFHDLRTSQTVEDFVLRVYFRNLGHLSLVQSSHKTKIKIPNVTIFISWLSLCVFSPDPPVQLLSDIEALGDTPPVEEVGGEPGEQPGQPPDPPGLVRTCTSRPGKQQARIKGY